MYTIVGLGNPGEEYEGTRHNVGREIVQSFAKKYGFSPWKNDKKANADVAGGEVAGKKVRVILPNTFMNNSGVSVSYYIKSPKLAKNLIVVHDDLDLPLAALKLVFSRGSGGHKGVESINKKIKTRDYIRLRVGISKVSRGKVQKPKGDEAVVEHVLGRMSKAEKNSWDDTVKKSKKILESIVEVGLEGTMNEYN